MKNSLYGLWLLTVLFLSAITTQAQSLKNLEDNNGFKKYKLGSKFVLGTGIKNKDEQGVDKVVIDYTKETIGDIPVKLIELYYARDTLIKIIVKVPIENYAKLIEACEGSFGPPTQNLSDNAETRKKNKSSEISKSYLSDHYVWKTKRFTLEYLYSYPEFSNGGYGVKNLYLSYFLNDYSNRIERIKEGSYSPKNF